MLLSCPKTTSDCMHEIKIMEMSTHLRLCGEMLIQLQQSISREGFQHCVAGPKLLGRL